jgi:preprotein translocase subunit SecG
MGTIGIILLVVFIVISILLIGIVLIQSEEGGGMGGLFGGAGSATFGSRSQTVITKTTYILVTLFFVISFSLAFVNKTPQVSNLEAAAQQVQSAEGGESKQWIDAESTTENPAPAEITAGNTETSDTTNTPE